MTNELFSRNCPKCNKKIYYKKKSYAVKAMSTNTLCSECRHKRTESEKEFNCFTCKKIFFRKHVRKNSTEKYFCSKLCWYANDINSLAGQRFGKLIPLAKYRKNNTTFYVCKCDCGKETTTSHSNLLSGNCKSCGCLLQEVRKSEREPLEKTISHSIWNYYQRNAKNRNYYWSISEEEFLSLIKNNCYYCGTEPFNYVKRRYKYETDKGLPFNGIDRLDNTLGYISGNCVPCCKICNAAKSDLSLEEFKKWIKKISTHIETIK